jgi:hypothetical protein
MNRRRRSWHVTHIAPRAELRPAGKAKPLTPEERFFIVLISVAAIYFGLGFMVS